MKIGLTSIIVPAYVQTHLSAHITMACLANIIKYTNPQDYELILIHDIPKHKVRDDYKVFEEVGMREIILDTYTNYSTKMNLAAKELQLKSGGVVNSTKLKKWCER